jgi:EmrB/QacA subfamily drug resistance transporter
MKKVILLLVVLTSFINPFLGAAINIALPAISQEFSMGAVGMSWVAMAFLLCSAVFLVPLGKLADIRGRKMIFLVGNAIITVTSVLCALSHTGGMLIASRALQGIGSAMVFGTGIAIITSVYPPEERGKAIGISVTAVYVGLSLAPFLGGLLTQYLGWRSIFYVPVPLGILILWVTLKFVREEWADARGERFDLAGSLVYLVSMSAFMFGFSRLPDTTAILLSSTGLIGLAGFIILERRSRYPVFNIRLFSTNRLFAMSNLAALINYATTFAITFLLSLYLQYMLKLTPRDAGVILVTQPVVMAVVASFSGRLSDKVDPRILASSGMAIIVAGLIMLSFLTDHSPVVFLMGILAVVGLGFGMFSSPNTNAIMGAVSKKYLGVASATVGTMRLTGQMMSMGIATLVLRVFLGNNPISPGVSGMFMISMKASFLVFAVLCIAGVFLSLARGRTVR